jgi:hypothetical protein
LVGLWRSMTVFSLPVLPNQLGCLSSIASRLPRHILSCTLLGFWLLTLLHWFSQLVGGLNGGLAVWGYRDGSTRCVFVRGDDNVVRTWRTIGMKIHLLLSVKKIVTKIQVYNCRLSEDDYWWSDQISSLDCWTVDQTDSENASWVVLCGTLFPFRFKWHEKICFLLCYFF